ncbi:MAG: CBS domain-containing protein [Thermomicrobiales bacterium]|nr:CBS domain-containing protein [Thermomicrobiales bacterium]MCO5222986.1 hypothetical protein [Thermomicrobiales bacterium]
MDWVAFGLPTTGVKAGAPRVTDAMRVDVPTCGLRDRLGAARAGTRSQGWEICVVTTDERVVLGLLHSDAWEHPDETPVEAVMSNGPPTTRPSTFLDEMVERLTGRKTPGILITQSDGVLMGYLWTDDACAFLATRNRERTWTDRDCCPSEVS